MRPAMLPVGVYANPSVTTCMPPPGGVRVRACGQLAARWRRGWSVVTRPSGSVLVAMVPFAA